MGAGRLTGSKSGILWRFSPSGGHRQPAGILQTVQTSQEVRGAVEGVKDRELDRGAPRTLVEEDAHTRVHIQAQVSTEDTPLPCLSLCELSPTTNLETAFNTVPLLILIEENTELGFA